MWAILADLVKSRRIFFSNPFIRADKLPLYEPNIAHDSSSLRRRYSDIIRPRLSAA